jgi:hypothetical protein
MADTVTEDKLDKITRVVIRTEVLVETLMKADAHTRLTKLEQAHKFWKGMAIAVPSIGGLCTGIWRIFGQ